MSSTNPLGYTEARALRLRTGGSLLRKLHASQPLAWVSWLLRGEAKYRRRTAEAPGEGDMGPWGAPASWVERAELVGLDPLPSGRATELDDHRASMPLPSRRSLRRRHQAHRGAGVVWNLPAVFAGGAFHPPVASAYVVPNLKMARSRAGSLVSRCSHWPAWRKVDGS